MPVRRPAAALLAAALLATGCTSGEEPASPAAPSETATPLAELDTASVVVRRSAFCGSLAEDAPADALGAEVDEALEYESGDRVEVVDGVRDVSHEFSCEYVAADGTAARAWVFAPAVTRGQARRLVRDTRSAPRCDEPAGAAGFGSPSVAVVCRDGQRVTASYRGLFGDAWLACSVSGTAGGDRGDLLARTEDWCVEVAAAASG